MIKLSLSNIRARIARQAFHSFKKVAGSLLRSAGNNNIRTPDGILFAVTPRMHPVDCYGLHAGLYEQDEISVLKRLFKPEAGAIVEIGANIGFISHYAFANMLCDGGQYIAIEPNPYAIATLKENMRRVQSTYPGKTHKIIEAAVNGKSDQEAPFVVRPTLCSGLAKHIKASGQEITLHVKTIKLSDVLARLGPKPVSLICDAEGADDLPPIYVPEGSRIFG